MTGLTFGTEKFAFATAHLPSGAAARLLWNSSKIANLSYQLCSIGANVGNIRYKKINKEKVTALELFQLVSSFIFFVDAVHKFETAGTLIRRAQLVKFEEILKKLPENETVNLDSELNKMIEETGCKIQGAERMLRIIENMSRDGGKISFPDEIQPSDQSSTAKKHSNKTGHYDLYEHDGKYITVPTKEAAIESAKQAVSIRYGGNIKNNTTQTTTVLSTNSAEFDSLVESNQTAGNGFVVGEETWVTLKGTLLGTNVKSVKVNNEVSHTVMGHVAITDVLVKLDKATNLATYLELRNCIKDPLNPSPDTIIINRPTGNNSANLPLFIDLSVFPNFKFENITYYSKIDQGLHQEKNTNSLSWY